MIAYGVFLHGFLHLLDLFQGHMLVIADLPLFLLEFFFISIFNVLQSVDHYCDFALKVQNLGILNLIVALKSLAFLISSFKCHFKI